MYVPLSVSVSAWMNEVLCLPVMRCVVVVVVLCVAGRVGDVRTLWRLAWLCWLSWLCWQGCCEGRAGDWGGAARGGIHTYIHTYVLMNPPTNTVSNSPGRPVGVVRMVRRVGRGTELRKEGCLIATVASVFLSYPVCVCVCECLPVCLSVCLRDR